uniref:Uncharacterized protein n=1 Tax=Arundo donax TaxID=35708 RepID=A0A0A9E882_ARUDO
MTTTKVLPRWPRMYGHASRKKPTNSSPVATPPPEPPTAQHRTPRRSRRGWGSRRLLEGTPLVAATRDADCETSPARRATAAYVTM